MRPIGAPAIAAHRLGVPWLGAASRRIPYNAPPGAGDQFVSAATVDLLRVERNHSHGSMPSYWPELRIPTKSPTYSGTNAPVIPR